MQGEEQARLQQEARQQQEFQQALSLYQAQQQEAERGREQQIGYHSRVLDLSKNLDPSAQAQILGGALPALHRLSQPDQNGGLAALVGRYAPQHSPLFGPPTFQGAGVGGAPIGGTADLNPLAQVQRQAMGQAAGLIPFGLGGAAMNALSSLPQAPGQLPGAGFGQGAPPGTPGLMETAPEAAAPGAEEDPSVFIPEYGTVRIGGVDPKERQQVAKDIRAALDDMADLLPETEQGQRDLQNFIGLTKTFRDPRTREQLQAARDWLTEAARLRASRSLAAQRLTGQNFEANVKRHGENVKQIPMMTGHIAAFALPDLLEAERNFRKQPQGRTILPRLETYAGEISRIRSLLSNTDVAGNPKSREQANSDRQEAVQLATIVKRQYATGLTPHQVESKITALEKELGQAHLRSPAAVEVIARDLEHWLQYAGRPLKIDAKRALQMPESLRKRLGQYDKSLEIRGDAEQRLHFQYLLDQDKFWHKQKEDAAKAGAKGVTTAERRLRLEPYEKAYTEAVKQWQAWATKHPLEHTSLMQELDGEPVTLPLEASPFYGQGKALLQRRDAARTRWYEANERMGISTKGLPRQEGQAPAGEGALTGAKAAGGPGAAPAARAPAGAPAAPARIAVPATGGGSRANLQSSSVRRRNAEEMLVAHFIRTEGITRQEALARVKELRQDEMREAARKKQGNPKASRKLPARRAPTYNPRAPRPVP